MADTANILETEVDHYKETCEIQRDEVSVRNRLFVSLWINMFVLYLFLISENETISAIQGWLRENLGVDASFSPSVFLAFCWIFLLYFCIRYIQVNIKIERDYKYISKLEAEIMSEGCKVFSREGESYLEDYPWILNYIDFLYKWFFPILLIIAVMLKIILEVIAHQSVIGLIVDVTVASADIVLWIGYLRFIIKMNSSNSP